MHSRGLLKHHDRLLGLVGCIVLDPDLPCALQSVNVPLQAPLLGAAGFCELML